MNAKSRPDRLAVYRGKRDFARTSEPAPAPSLAQGHGFVVQKHDARRLHYDLRLELDGVLLSWAVPQGPSLISTEKRLAVRTEDHPLKYLDFEGVIPKGEYGGGTMIVWDRGDWAPVHDPQKSIAKGHLEFELRGKRLKGRWHLVRMKPRPREKNEQWLLIKAADEYERTAFDSDLLQLEDTSVLSGLTNEELAAADAVREDHAGRMRASTARATPVRDAGRVTGARKALLRLFVEPSLASQADRPPTGAHWLHEVKFDGYRIEARVDGSEIKLLTRKGLDWAERFPAVAAAVRDLELGSALLDGEIVSEEAGIPSFNALVSDLKSGRQDRMRYYVFDLLYLNGVDLQSAALIDRKEVLAEILASAPPNPHVALSEHFEIDGAVFFEHVSRLGLEGMVSKRRDRPYRSGRNKDWLKSKCVMRQEFVIVGYVPSTTSKRAVGSLVLGYYEGDALLHAGRAGSGFGREEAEELFAVLDAMRIGKPSFGRKLVAGAEVGIRWVEPRLVAEVEYRGWSLDGLLWHTTYLGLRQDKDPREVALEVPRSLQSPAATGPALTHADRVLWPAEGVTKQGLANFYTEIADWILPHLRGRPLSLVRCPGGVAEPCFYAKHGWAGLSNAVRRVDTGDGETMLIVDDLTGLMELVQANVLEIHPWGSTLDELDRPDRLIFDLDPDENVPWSAVIEAAREVRERLRTQFELESFVKTSGGKGLHVVVPVIPSLEWAPAKDFCKRLAEAMAADSPRRYVANMAKNARKGKIYVDYVRNGRGATAVAPYSTRARPAAAVSTPLGWGELSDAVKSDHYRVGNLGRRLAFLANDPWPDFFSLKQKLPAEARAPGRKARARDDRPSRR